MPTPRPTRQTRSTQDLSKVDLRLIETQQFRIAAPAPGPKLLNRKKHAQPSRHPNASTRRSCLKPAKRPPTLKTPDPTPRGHARTDSADHSTSCSANSTSSPELKPPQERPISRRAKAPPSSELPLPDARPSSHRQPSPGHIGRETRQPDSGRPIAKSKPPLSTRSPPRSTAIPVPSVHLVYNNEPNEALPCSQYAPRGPRLQFASAPAEDATEQFPSLNSPLYDFSQHGTFPGEPAYPHWEGFGHSELNEPGDSNDFGALGVTNPAYYPTTADSTRADDSNGRMPPTISSTQRLPETLQIASCPHEPVNHVFSMGAPSAGRLQALILPSKTVAIAPSPSIRNQEPELDQLYIPDELPFDDCDEKGIYYSELQHVKCEQIDATLLEAWCFYIRRLNQLSIPGDRARGFQLRKSMTRQTLTQYLLMMNDQIQDCLLRQKEDLHDALGISVESFLPNGKRASTHDISEFERPYIRKVKTLARPIAHLDDFDPDRLNHMTDNHRNMLSRKEAAQTSLNLFNKKYAPEHHLVQTVAQFLANSQADREYDSNYINLYHSRSGQRHKDMENVELRLYYIYCASEFIRGTH